MCSIEGLIFGRGRNHFRCRNGQIQHDLDELLSLARESRHVWISKVGVILIVGYVLSFPRELLIGVF